MTYSDGREDFEVRVYQVIDGAPEFICAARFPSMLEARRFFQSLYNFAQRSEEELTAFCDLLMYGDIVDTFKFRVWDITRMTGYLPKDRATTLSEHRAIAAGGPDTNQARLGAVEGVPS